MAKIRFCVSIPEEMRWAIKCIARYDGVSSTALMLRVVLRDARKKIKKEKEALIGEYRE